MSLVHSRRHLVVQPLLTRLQGQGAHSLSSLSCAVDSPEREELFLTTPPVTCTIGVTFHHPADTFSLRITSALYPRIRASSVFRGGRDQKVLLWVDPHHKDSGPPALSPKEGMAD